VLIDATSTSRAAPQVVTIAREAYQLVRAQQTRGKSVGLIPTMGALHAGHLSLVDRSIGDCDFTVVSIFVNPKQFNQPADYSVYPRTLQSDLHQLAERKVDLVFAPSVEEMYPADFSTHVEVEGITSPWEGASRPGHFRGVTTVVLKLFQIIPADRAYFGRKDFQQTLAVRRMAADLNLPTEVVVCPLVRDHDGLALSSRNVHLSPDDRQSALVLSRSVRLARDIFAGGERDPQKLRAAMLRIIADEPSVKLEYLAIVDPRTLAELKRTDGDAVALIAARVGATRLIDNEVLQTNDES
jgi:pantoate--beta-alanine ligase